MGWYPPVLYSWENWNSLILFSGLGKMRRKDRGVFCSLSAVCKPKYVSIKGFWRFFFLLIFSIFLKKTELKVKAEASFDIYIFLLKFLCLEYWFVSTGLLIILHMSLKCFTYQKHDRENESSLKENTKNKLVNVYIMNSECFLLKPFFFFWPLDLCKNS